RAGRDGKSGTWSPERSQGAAEGTRRIAQRLSGGRPPSDPSPQAGGGEPVAAPSPQAGEGAGAGSLPGDAGEGWGGGTRHCDGHDKPPAVAPIPTFPRTRGEGAGRSSLPASGGRSGGRSLSQPRDRGRTSP